MLSGALDEEEGRVFQVSDHLDEELGRVGTVSDPVVEGEGKGEDAADCNLPLVDPGALADAAEAEDGHVGPVDDGGGEYPAEVAVVGKGEGAPPEFLGAMVRVRAFFPSSWISAASWIMLFRSTSRMTGTMRPSGGSTAMPKW